MSDMPGDSVDIPIPPALAETLGYRGDARYVAFYWSSLGDELVYTDGAGSGSGQSWAYLSIARHRAVAPHLQGVNLGFSDADAESMLVVDRQERIASIAPVAEAREFLANQHAKQEPLSPEEQAEFERDLNRMLKEWREAPIDHEALVKRMREQSARMAVMLAFLDQQVAPGQGPTP